MTDDNSVEVDRQSHGYHDDLRVDKYHGEIIIYDKLGRGGTVSLSDNEAEYVEERLGEILDND